MPAFASMLRAVNVGGRNAIGMAALAEVYQGLGLTGVTTVLQSGNVVFRGGPQDRAALAGLLSDAIARRFGVQPEVLLRTHAELRSAVTANPFPEAARDDPSHLAVVFLEAKPAPGVLAGYAGPERFALVGKELFVHYREGLARSKLTLALIEKTGRARGTARNWNTVNKLLRLCAALEDRP